MAEVPTYNDGMWTPDESIVEATQAIDTQALETEADLATSPVATSAVAVTTTVAALQPTTTTSPQAIQATTSSAVAVTIAQTTTPLPSSATPSTSTPSPIVSTTRGASSASSLTSSQVSTLSSVSSASALPASALPSSSQGSSFNSKVLIIPLAVGVPIVLALLAVGLTYGKCWGKRRSRGNDGAWPTDTNQDDAQAFVQSPPDDNGEWDEFDEKAAYPVGSHEGAQGSSGWLGYVPASLRRGLSTASRRFGSRGRHGQDTLTGGRRSIRRQFGRQPLMEEPFQPPHEPFERYYDHAPPPSRDVFPSQSGVASSNNQRWNWTDPVASVTAKPTASPALPGGWGWMGHGTRGEVRGTRQDILRNDYDSAKAPLSPSIYSPDMGGGGAYAGLQEEDEDEPMSEQDLNAYLGQSRVGNDRLAKRFIRGEDVSDELPVRVAGPPARAPYATQQASVFGGSGVAPYLPAPGRTASSPTKAGAGSALLRGQAQPGPTPPRTGLLFKYDSPGALATPPSPRPPLPKPPGQTEPPLASLIPDFADPAPLQRLDHPSRVRNAIMNLEERQQDSSARSRVTGAKQTYSRPIKSGDDVEVTNLLLERRKTAEGRPLSGDPKRLSAMLRRPSQGGQGDAAL